MADTAEQFHHQTFAPLNGDGEVLRWAQRGELGQHAGKFHIVVRHYPARDDRTIVVDHADTVMR